MHSISNYIVIDSERSYVGLFDGINADNLIIINPKVRGDYSVGAIAARGWGTNVHVIGGQVWGTRAVGGFAGVGGGTGIGVYGTEIRYEGGGAGGIVGASNYLIKDCVMTGNIQPAGVPGASNSIGGIVGHAQQRTRVENCLHTGNVVALNSFHRETAVGGIVGMLEMATVVNSRSTGNIVATGSGVGGIVGVAEGHPKYSNNYYQNANFGHDAEGGSLPAWITADPEKYQRYLRGGYVAGNTFTGSAWGGYSRKYLKCVDDDVITIIGKGADEECGGDIKESSGGDSKVGGIVGHVSQYLLQDNKFTGSVRGVKAVGGIAGHQQRRHCSVQLR